MKALHFASIAFLAVSLSFLSCGKDEIEPEKEPEAETTTETTTDTTGNNNDTSTDGEPGGPILAKGTLDKGNGGGTTSFEVSWNSYCDNYYDIEVIESGAVVKSGKITKQGDSYFYVPIDKETTKTISVRVSYSSGSDLDNSKYKCYGRDPVTFGPYTVEREDEVNVLIGQ